MSSMMSDSIRRSPKCGISADTSRLGGLSSEDSQAITSRLLDQYRTKMDEYQTKISELQSQMLQIASVHNSAALIHVKLPRELLMHIFRSLCPESPSAIEVSHVCRLWRSLINAVPDFWECLLASSTGIVFDAPQWSTLVLDIIAKSVPRKISFSLNGKCFRGALFAPLTVHLHRFTSITLDGLFDDAAPDLTAFYNLPMPHLENLTIFLPADCHESIPDKTVMQGKFPCLRSFNTNCATLAPLAIATTIRQVIVGCTPDTFHYYCCCFDSTKPLLERLAQCPDLETLELFGCLPDSPEYIHRPPHLHHLSSCTIQDHALHIRNFLEHCLVLPRRAALSIVADDAPSLSLPIPVSLPPWFSTIDRVSLYVPPSCPPDTAILQGYAGAEKRLKVSLEDRYSKWGAMWKNPQSIGAVSVLGSVDVNALDIRIDGSMLPQKETWATVLHAYPSLITLTVESTSVSTLLHVLAADETPIQTLKTLHLTTCIHEPRAVVVVAEALVARGIRLLDVIYRVRAEGEVEFSEPMFSPEDLQELQRLATNLEVAHIPSKDLSSP